MDDNTLKKERTGNLEYDVGDFDIAVIGMECRFPGAGNIPEYWDVLKSGKECVIQLTDEELLESGISKEILADANYIKAASMIGDYDKFDAEFFGYSPKEAAMLDPQQRLFLELAWHALEKAGYDSENYRGAIGVFAGATFNSYLLNNIMRGRTVQNSSDAFFMQILNDKDNLATRLSYKLNLGGPSLSIQTACSTSLVAIHYSSQSLLNHECDIALAGGVTVRAPHKSGYFYENEMILSKDGHCRPFDANASGTIFGSGAGIVVLKRLEDAISDKDQIYAVIKGSAVNNDGSDKIGFTAPGRKGQQVVLTSALAISGVPKESISAIEAHGTGTMLGDPIEFESISKVYGSNGKDNRKIPIGSVKSNLGHLECAAGIASFIKMVLCLYNKTLVPSLNYSKPNPHINLENSNFYVNTETKYWEVPGNYPRRCAVSSFGIGGTNAHLILEEALPARKSVDVRPMELITLSAKTPATLSAQINNVYENLKLEKELNFSDVAATLRSGRRPLEYRQAFFAKDREALLKTIEEKNREKTWSFAKKIDDPKVAFLFPGQGSQYVEMAVELYSQIPLFKKEIDECAKILLPLLNLDIRHLIFPAKEKIEETEKLLYQTEYTQPAMFVIEYCLARLLMSWGIRPDAMIGHSIGEYAAACLAGVFSLKDALTVVAKRGELINKLPGGSMCGVLLAADNVKKLLTGDLALAASNGPALSVVSGPTDQITRFVEKLKKEGIDYRLLHTSHAFHSGMLKPAYNPFQSLVSDIKLNPPQMPYISNLSGNWVTEKEATSPKYWADHMLNMVDFSAGIRKLLPDNRYVYVEVGPGTSLSTFIKNHDHKISTIACLPHANEGRCSLECLNEALGKIWSKGVKIDWSAYADKEIRQKVVLPCYPFQKKSFWINPVVDGTQGESLEKIKIVHSKDEEKDIQHSNAEKILPRNELERALYQIFENTLGVENISIKESFFELGGHSLLATQLLTKANTAFHTQVKLRNFFLNPTVEGLAKEILSTSNKINDDKIDSFKLPDVIIDPENRYEPFPLTEMQQAQWLGRISSFSMGNIAAQVYVETEKEGLDLDRLQTTWQMIVDRHDMLRAVLLPDGGQRILPKPQIYKIRNHDFRHLDPATAEKEVLQVRAEMDHAVRPIDKWPLFEVRSTQLPGNKVRVHFSIDLLICDVGSFRILQSEWGRLYKNPDLKLPEIEFTFRDYVVAEKKIKHTELFAQSDVYWEEQVKKLPEMTAPQLPIMKDPASIGNMRFKRWSFIINKEKWERIKERCMKMEVFPSSVILGAFSCIIGNWCKNTEFCINTPIINRIPMHPQVKELLGEFASFAPVPVSLQRGKTFLELVKELQRRNFENLEYRYISGTSILRKMAKLRGSGAGAVLPVVFTSTIVQAVQDEAEFERQLGEYTYVISQTPQVWLDHTAMENLRGLLLSWHAVPEMFPAGMLDTMWNTYEAFMNNLADDDSTWEKCYYDLLLESEREIKALANNTDKQFTYELMHLPFIKQAEKNPEKIALVNNDKSISYGTLAAWSRSLGKYLRDAGVQRQELVAIVMGKGYEQVVAALSILQAGGAYLPLDPHLPQERLEYILDTCKVRIALTQEMHKDTIAWPGNIKVWSFSEENLNALKPCKKALEPVQELDDLAYVIFTSGSTGKPKGVMISHKAAQNTIMDINERFNVTNQDAGFAISELNFDLSVYDIFGLLSEGGTLVIPKENSARDPEHWYELITKHNVTVWNSVPALMVMLTEYVETKTDKLPLRLVMLSGDWIPVNLPAKIKHRMPAVELISLGGATEGSIWSICYPVKEINPHWTSIPYGKPLSNQQFHVFNKDLAPCPVWVPGDLYIGGTGVAMGYLNEPELTAHSYITHPDTNERLYRTGDLGRYLPDGNIEFMGREDFQVKISGFRVELEDIESALVQHPAVKSALVNAIGKSRENKHLVAYVILHDNSEFKPDEVKSFLAGKLPDYMIPNDYVTLEAFPLTPNGKIDRKALPEPQAVKAELKGDNVQTGILVKKLVAVFAEVLQLKEADVNVNANFFAMGGDSILGIQIISKLSKDGIKLLPQQLFDHPTINQLAGILDVDNQFMLESGNRFKGTLPLVPVQHWLLENYGYSSSALNWSVLVKLKTPLEPGLIESSLQYLVSQYDALQLSYVFQNYIWKQSYQEDAKMVELDYVDISGMDETEMNTTFNNIRINLSQSQDLAESPLLKLCLFNNEPDRIQYLLLICNQLIMDFRSLELFLRNLYASYLEIAKDNKAGLVAPAVQFKDWSARYQNKESQAKAEKNMKAILQALPEKPLAFNGGTPSSSPSDSCEIVYKLDNKKDLERFNEALDISRARPEELFLLALGSALKKNDLADHLYADCVLGAGANDPGQEDFNEVIGNCMLEFPVYLEPADGKGSDSEIIGVKNQIRKFRNYSDAYGILCYLSENEEIQEQLKTIPEPSVKFAYHECSGTPHAFSWEQFEKYSIEKYSLQNYLKDDFPYQMEIDVMKMPDAIHIFLNFDPLRTNFTVMNNLGMSLQEECRRLVDFILKEDKILMTPADFPDAEWHSNEFNDFLKAFAKNSENN